MSNTTSTPKNYSLVCGMEVHAELKTNSKMFCGCANDPFNAPEPNTHTCPVCLGMPGGLPVPNKTAIEWTLKLGLALNCKINLFSKFDRKHYFYPDLPKGYQISQYDIPFCYDGSIETSEGTVRIRRIHLEEDTAKLMHTAIDGTKVSLIDFNRGGVPLIEIVTEPDITSPAHAREYGKKLRQILRYLDIADCDMEQGGMRLEANVSLTDNPGGELPNYKVELKNINSFKFLEQAVAYEMKRQTIVLDRGETPVQETRGWDSNKQQSVSQRVKEDAEDYRYFPDPDIPPLHFTQEQINAFKAELPAMIEVVAKNWKETFNVEERFTLELLTSSTQLSWFEQLWHEAKTKSIEANKLASALVNKKLPFEVGITTVRDLVAAFSQQNQTETVDTGELKTIMDSVITEFPAEVARYKAGETKLTNFFIGQIMRKLGKKVDMRTIAELLENSL